MGLRSSVLEGTEHRIVTVELPDDRSVDLVFPDPTDDPIAIEYESGLRPNEYLTELLLLLTKPGDRVVDLGAHLGTFSVPAAGLGRSVLAVDAARSHVEVIRESRRINDLAGLEVVHAAVADTEGEVAFREAGLWGMIDLTDDPASGRVRGRRLDRILEEIGWDRIDLLKMDIEGSELAALRGCEALLSAADGPAVIYESNGETSELFGYSIPELRGYLESFGYRTFRYEHGRLVYSAPDDLQPEMWLDVVALNGRDRHRLRDRIDEAWSHSQLVGVTVHWGRLPHENTKRYLARELRRRPELVAGSPELTELLATLPLADP